MPNVQDYIQRRRGSFTPASSVQAFIQKRKAEQGRVTPQDDFDPEAEALKRRNSRTLQPLVDREVDDVGGAQRFEDTQGIMAGLGGYAAGIAAGLPVIGRMTRRWLPPPVDTAPAPPAGTTAYQIGSGLTRTLPEILLAGRSGGPLGMAGAAAAGQTDDLAYMELLKRLQSGQQGNYLGDLARGSGIMASGPQDTAARRAMRFASIPAAAAGAGLGGILAKTAGLGANVAFDAADALGETALNLAGQGTNIGDPGWGQQVGMSGGIAALVSALLGRMGPARPKVDMLPPDPFRVLPEGRAPRQLPPPPPPGLPDGRAAGQLPPPDTSGRRALPQAPDLAPGQNVRPVDETGAPIEGQWIDIPDQGMRFVDRGRGTAYTAEDLARFEAQAAGRQRQMMADTRGLPPPPRLIEDQRFNLPPPQDATWVTPPPPPRRPGMTMEEIQQARARMNAPPPPAMAPDVPRPAPIAPAPREGGMMTWNEFRKQTGNKSRQAYDLYVIQHSQRPARSDAPQALTPEELRLMGGTPNDRQNQPGLPGQEQRGQGDVQAQPDQGGSAQASAPDRILQTGPEGQGQAITLQEWMAASRIEPAEGGKFIAKRPDGSPILERGGVPMTFDSADQARAMLDAEHRFVSERQARQNRAGAVVDQKPPQSEPQAPLPVTDDQQAAPPAPTGAARFKMDQTTMSPVRYIMNTGGIRLSKGNLAELERADFFKQMTPKEKEGQTLTPNEMDVIEWLKANGHERMNTGRYQDQGPSAREIETADATAANNRLRASKEDKVPMPVDQYIEDRRIALDSDLRSQGQPRKEIELGRLPDGSKVKIHGDTFTVKMNEDTGKIDLRNDYVLEAGVEQVVPVDKIVEGKMLPRPKASANPFDFGELPPPNAQRGGQGEAKGGIEEVFANPLGETATRIINRIDQAIVDMLGRTTSDERHNFARHFYRPEEKLKGSETGRKASARLNATETDRRTRMANNLYTMNKAAERLSWGDRSWLRSNFKAAYEDGRPMPNPRLQAYADAWSQTHAADAAEAQRLGTKIQTREGEKDFAPIENYFPHILTPEARQALERQAGPVYEKIVEAATSKGFDPSVIADLVDLSGHVKKYGHLEMAREAWFPDFVEVNGRRVPVLETDPFKVLPAHIERAARRLAFIKNWGQKTGLKEAEAYSRQLMKEGNPEAARAFDAAWKDVQGIEVSGLERHLPAWIRPLETIARTGQLSGAVVSNLTGPVPIIARYGALPTLKNTAKVITEGVYRNLIKNPAGKLGVELRDLKTTAELEAARKWGGWDKDYLSHSYYTEDMVDAFGKGGRAALRATGFEGVNRYLNKIASLSARDALLDAVQYLRNPSDAAYKKVWGRTTAQVQDMLAKEFRFTPEDITRMQARGIAERDFAQAIQHASARANVFHESPLDRPRWMNDPVARRLLTYSSYARVMGNTMSDAIHYAKTGNALPLARLLVGGAAIGAGVDKLKDLIYRREKEDKGFWAKLWAGLMESSTLGLLGSYGSDLYWAGKQGTLDQMLSVPMVSFYNGFLSEAKKYFQGKQGAGQALYKGAARGTPALRAADAHLEGPYWQSRQDKNKGLPLPDPRLSMHGRGRAPLPPPSR